MDLLEKSASCYQLCYSVVKITIRFGIEPKLPSVPNKLIALKIPLNLKLTKLQDLLLSTPWSKAKLLPSPIILVKSQHHPSEYLNLFPLDNPIKTQLQPTRLDKILLIQLWRL